VCSPGPPPGDLQKRTAIFTAAFPRTASREVPSALVITDYHAKYYAHALTRRSASDNLEKLGQTLLNATVDLNPHQIDAAMFAFRSPLSREALKQR